MVSNFNLTWKSACLEILNYVCPFEHSQPVEYLLLLKFNSSLRGLQDRLSKRDKLLWYGDSGWQVYLGILLIGNGHNDKLPKRKTISLIGVFLFSVIPLIFVIHSL